MPRVLVIQPNGHQETADYQGDEPPLELLQQLVPDTYFELCLVQHDGKIYNAYCDEDGRRRALTPNLADVYGRTLVGPIILDLK